MSKPLICFWLQTPGCYVRCVSLPRLCVSFVPRVVNFVGYFHRRRGAEARLCRGDKSSIILWFVCSSSTSTAASAAARICFTHLSLGQIESASQLRAIFYTWTLVVVVVVELFFAFSLFVTPSLKLNWFWFWTGCARYGDAVDQSTYLAPV